MVIILLSRININVKHLSHKELLHEGFGSFMKKVGAGVGAAGRELGKQLLKDAPALVGAAKGMGNILKAATDTDPKMAIKKYFETTKHGKTAFDDDIRQRDSLGEPKPEPGNKHKIDVPINRGTHDKDGKKFDLAGGRISLTRDDESGGWYVNGFFGKDSEENLMPVEDPAVTGGKPISPEDATPGAEIKDSKGVVLKVGDQVEFTKGARELKGKKGSIKLIQDPTNITISVDPGGSEANGVDPQLVVKIADGEGEPPADPSRPEAEGGDELDSGPETVTSANFKEKLKAYVAKEKPGHDLTSKEAIAGFVRKLAKEAGNNNWYKHIPTKLKQVKPDAVEYTNKAVWTNEELNKLVQHLIQQDILKESQKNLLQHLTLLAR